jgi:hypothetical protein
MKTKPISLSIYALIFLGIALSIPIQIMMLYEHSISEISLIISKMTPMNWAVVASTLMLSVGCFRASSSTWFLLPISVALIFINNLLVGQYAVDYSPFQASLASLLFMGLSLSFLATKGQDAISSPHLKWWMIPTRHRIALAIRMVSPDGVDNVVRSFDISSNGLFLAKSSEKNSDELPLGKEVDICIGDKNGPTLKAQVVRLSKETRGGYPPGVGLTFIHAKMWDKIKLWLLLKRVEGFYAH